MELTALVAIAVAVILWGLLSARLERADLTAPAVFVALGGLLVTVGLVDAPEAPKAFRPLVEITLVWVLFSDAAGVPFRKLRADLGLCLRLLAVGLPLTVLAGWGLARLLFPGLELWLALLVGAALAPTDAALGLPVVSNPRVPARVRRLLTVESGLNDGIITPVVLLAIAGAATAEGVADAPGPAEAAVELAVGVGVGVAVGGAGGALLRVARRRAWADEDFTGIAVLMLALAAYAASLLVHGNGFVAAFCGGLAFGAAAGRRGPEELKYLEQTAGLASLLVWLAFGAVAVPIVLGSIEGRVVLYAVLSLTLVRMVPVALATVRSGLDSRSVLFVGWFGPRGLASLVFALLAVEELGSGADEAVAVIGVTVLLSVLAHGFTSMPLANRFGELEAGPPGSRIGEPGGSR